VLKKRIIFTLLYDNGFFNLSRNFRLQRVGDLDWLIRNYDFARTASYIDELVLLNVSRDSNDNSHFVKTLRFLTEICFVPITAGGHIKTRDHARALLSNGADKILMNTLAIESPQELETIAELYGRQSIVLGIDFKRIGNSYTVMTHQGTRVLPIEARTYLRSIGTLPFGELYLTSIDRDGTGQGFDSSLLDLVPPSLPCPVTLAGGAAKPEHFMQMLSDSRVSALATAHLYNFLGDGLLATRNLLLKNGCELAAWHPHEILRLKNSLQ
jgi:cyclase